MRKYRIFLIAVLMLLLGVLAYHNREYLFGDPQKTVVNVENTDSMPVVSNEGETECMVYPSGQPIGIYVKTKGVMVIGVNAVQSADGTEISPCEGALIPGDYIMWINGKAVNDKTDLIALIQQSEGEEILLRVCRENQYRNICVTPIKKEDGKYAIGVWVKDDISGIGTLTYTDGERFAALGHSINDNDTGLMFRVSDGAVYDTTIVRIRKPEQDTPGRLEGIINYTGRYVIGRVEENSAYGIHGYLTKRQQKTHENDMKVAVGHKSDVHVGTAYLLSSVSGESKNYKVEIVSVDADNENGRCMELKVTDPDLLTLTGGIVQGMSGTPILQDGRLIGAVTHVFVNDSTRGYGIFIEEMMQ